MIISIPLARIRFCTQAWAPENTNVASPNPGIRSASVGRPERFGPRKSLSLSCQTEMNRVTGGLPLAGLF